MASWAGSSTASSSGSSIIDLRRTRRIISTRLGQSTEFPGQASIFIKDSSPYPDDDDYKPTGVASFKGGSIPRISDPDTDLKLDALFKIILDVFTRDIATDNSLHMATRIKTDYKCLPFVGVGASYLVRKLDDVPVGSRGSGSIFSSRVGEKLLTSDMSSVKEKQRVSKQLRATRTTRNPEGSRQLLDATMTELCILTHHPLKMHDNILDFFGVMWEYDDVWRVWPVLILEYADMGTLTKCLAGSEKFTFLQKMQLCLDIGNGLDALHTCEVSHGDIKPDNIFVFRDATRGLTAKLGDFSTSIIGAAMKSNPMEALRMGGYTPLWVAPEHPEIPSFARLLAMDVFSYGLCVWAVAENGELPLAEAISRGGNAMAALKESKRYPRVLYQAVQSAQRPGICDDINVDLFSGILEATLCRADDRRLSRALEPLRSFCGNQRTNIRSPLRPMRLEDLISTATPNKTLREPLSDVEMRVLKELPRPLLIQLRRRVEKASAQASSRPPITPSEELHGSQWSSVIFRLQLENLGSWTLLEAEARRGNAPWKVRLTRPDAAEFMGEDTQIHDPDKGISRAVIEKAILGAACDGSPDYSLDRYAFSRNEKTSSAVRYLFRNDPVDIGETALAFSATMALRHTDGCSMDTLAHCSKMGNMTGMHSLIRQPDIPFSSRLEALQMLADTPMTEPTTDLVKLFEQAMKNGMEDRITDMLPASFLGAMQGRGNVSQSLSSLAARISHLPQLAERIRVATPQELDRSEALISACQFGNSTAARLLLSHGARGGVTNDRGLGPLHFLSSIDPAEQSSLARELVAAGANPNGWHAGLGTRTIVIPGLLEISSVSGSPLHHAVLHNDLGAVKTLIEWGSMPLMAHSKGNEFLTPLALAAALHCPETLKMLVDASDIGDIGEWTDHFGNNLVSAALDSQWNTLRMGIHLDDFYPKTKETLKMLWDLGADFEKVSFAWEVPALHYACKMASVNVVALLLEMGLRHQVNEPATDSAIHLPLHQALETGNEHLVLLLLDQGADISIHGKEDAYCLHQAIKSGTATEDATDHTVIFFLDLLLDRGANINELSMGRSPLYQAVAAGLYGVAGHLLARGADMDAGLDQGLTMLGRLVQHEDRPTPALFFLLGQVILFVPPGHLVGPGQLSALHLAAGAYKRPNPDSDATEVLEFLLLTFPNAEHLECAWGRWGLTPLMIAVVTCNTKAAKLLIEAGASVRTKASFGWSLASLLLRERAIEALVRFRMAFVYTLRIYADIGEPNMTFDNAVFLDILAIIRECCLNPRPAPLHHPPGTSKASRSSRVQALHELIRQHNLKISDISETQGGGAGRMYLKEADVESHLRMLDVPTNILSELSLVLHPSLIHCPYIVHVSAYTWMRTEIKSPYRPVLLWELAPSEVFLSLADHLSDLRTMPFECGVYICSHLAAGLSALHTAGFTHGRLDVDHVRIRNIIKKRASETTLAGDTQQSQPVTAQLWDFDYSSNVQEDKAYHIYYQSESRTPFQAPELEQRPARSKVAEKFDTLKKYEVYALGILILVILGGLDPRRVLSRTGVYNRNAAINSAISKLVERSRASKIGDGATAQLVPSLRKLLSEDPTGRPAEVGEVAAALRSLHKVGKGIYILQAQVD